MDVGGAGPRLMPVRRQTMAPKARLLRDCFLQRERSRAASPAKVRVYASVDFEKSLYDAEKTASPRHLRQVDIARMLPVGTPASRSHAWRREGLAP